MRGVERNAVMLAYGFRRKMLAGLVLAGLATVVGPVGRPFQMGGTGSEGALQVLPYRVTSMSTWTFPERVPPPEGVSSIWTSNRSCPTNPGDGA
jgi:hypothetical protein